MFSIKALFVNINIVSHLLPLFLFFIFFARNKRKDIRVIFFYCIYTFINELFVTNLLNIEINASVRFTLLSLFTVVEYSLFTYAIFLNIKKSLYKRIIIAISPIFFMFAIFQFFNPEVKNNIDSISITIEYILLIIYSLFYFFEELNEPNTTFIYSSHSFWIVVGILIYSTGTFFFFMQSNNLSDEEWYRWSVINDIFTIIKNLFFSIAIVIRKNISSENSFKSPYDEFFEKPITPL